jgi:hypothetical protein
MKTMTILQSLSHQDQIDAARREFLDVYWPKFLALYQGFEGRVLPVDDLRKLQQAEWNWFVKTNNV